ncbi:MAG: VOC family protein [Alphaproteobacteria bacterium]|nr:VOC family protein [Alphaproteobacteria bacterium]
MMKFDHLNLPVRDLDRSRDWWVSVLGLMVEFEVPQRRAVALQDSGGFAIFLEEKDGAAANGVALWFKVDDVDAAFRTWTERKIAFAHGPQKTFWGYGAELADPDGYVVRLWDERSMREK